MAREAEAERGKDRAKTHFWPAVSFAAEASSELAEASDILSRPCLPAAACYLLTLLELGCRTRNSTVVFPAAHGRDLSARGWLKGESK